jgi:hypothetical protein
MRNAEVGIKRHGAENRGLSKRKWEGGLKKQLGKDQKNYYHGTPRKITEKNLCYSVKISGEK